ncbi:formamidopyrimidine-DNA glycosylase [Desulfosporosinus orientis DSM 765]|uniref:Formamidopyrimidine-DNA glycosylase n=1 Tax=Desulfosporosinus orientis (strain ATCC 19365 / DSM 765 / NCIMB 8382 / VKM B-1628 / Singapore I) TaxID=768706 RepID=G7WBV0_DESOD|nr:DNA-formamidopyrimidine glycosylase family protein [Desulfosporosinus orientis]AET69347.1 formamidopyrimidine-DNA glycosylase [Desulfosporosinus orientis DSM 765]
MLELPEAITVAKQLNKHIAGKKIRRVLPPSKVHKFCWYAGDPSEYDAQMSGSTVQGAEGFGIYVEVTFDHGKRLCFNDGVNARLIDSAGAPKNHQLLIEFDDGTALVFTVAMYGSIILHDDTYDNEYYLKSKSAVSPFSHQFEPYFRKMITECKPTLSAKAFLATQQRFPGIGNGVLQDILFAAGIYPKRKLSTFSDSDQDHLLTSVISILRDMTDLGGRDTEKDILGQPGGYRTKLSKNTLALGCPQCEGQLVKETYLGGSIYYCPSCQPPY